MGHGGQIGGAAERARDAAVFAAQVEMLGQQTLFMLSANIVLAALIAAALQSAYPAPVLASWLGLLCITMLGRLVLVRRYRRSVRTDDTARRWARRFAIGTL